MRDDETRIEKLDAPSAETPHEAKRNLVTLLTTDYGNCFDRSRSSLLKGHRRHYSAVQHAALSCRSGVGSS